MHQPVRLDESRGVYFVAFPLGFDGIRECHLQTAVVGPRAKKAAKIGLIDGEKAIAQLAVGRNANAVAGSAEWLGD